MERCECHACTQARIPSLANQLISSQCLDERYEALVKEIEWKQKIYENLKTAHMDWMNDIERRLAAIESKTAA